MSGGISFSSSVCVGLDYGTSGAVGTAIANPTSTNVKGAWTQIVASTTADAAFISVSLTGDNTIDSSAPNIAVDIGVGGAGSELVVLNNLWLNSYSGPNTANYVFPLLLPSGTRLSARSQSAATGAGSSCYVNCQLFDSQFASGAQCSGVDCLGASLSGATAGTAVTPNATANTKGSYAQLIASTARDYFALMAACTFNPQTNHFWAHDISIGAAASEVVIVPNVLHNFINNVNAMIPKIEIDIPSGTRLAMRSACNAASTPASNWVIYGLYK